jgi:basic membrane lipoprotein Med (substrate-binding protein (PBP1-ABC) superfamily)
VIDLPHVFLTVARAVKEGSFKPAVLSLGASSNVVRLSLNPAHTSRIPDSVRAPVDSLWQAIIRGDFRVPVGDSTAGRRP